MRIRIMLATICGIVTAMPGIAAAQGADNYRCTFGGLTRRIEIVRETGVLVPCEVHYYRDDETAGEQQVLWRAQNEAGYCEARAAEFVDKLSDWGWDCSSDEPAAPVFPEEAEPEEAEPDDMTAEEDID